MTISNKTRRLAVGVAITALSAGLLTTSPAFARVDTVVHPAPDGCDVTTTGYVGSAQCAFASTAFQVVVRCSDGSYRNGPWITGPSPKWSNASCYNNAPEPYATDVWINLPD
ncbi:MULTISPECIES: hypothetical protein [unclassified Kribbella]|uniref:hypothetical protein n=1 Tax=unclassified Kribbella TaxID=2644121 RepID=UPI003077BCC6